MAGDRTPVRHRVIPALVAVLALLLPNVFALAPAYATPPPRHVDITATDESDPLNLFRLIFRHRHSDLRPSGDGRFGWGSNVAVLTTTVDGMTLYIAMANYNRFNFTGKAAAVVDIFRVDDSGKPYLVDRYGKPLKVDWRTSYTPSATINLLTSERTQALGNGPIHSEAGVDAVNGEMVKGTDIEILSERVFCAEGANQCMNRLKEGKILSQTTSGRYLTKNPTLSPAQLKELNAELDEKIKDGELSAAEKQAAIAEADAATELQEGYQRWKEAGMPDTFEALTRFVHAVNAFTVSGSSPPGGVATKALTGKVGTAPGGIDFSTLQLRYLAEDEKGRLRYSYDAAPTTAKDQHITEGQLAAAQMSDAFFVWLSLPRDTFWVNLNPREPDRIIDKRLAGTDAGRILLEADLRMKRDSARLTNPETALGRRFWGKPGPSGAQECGVIRQWIVPKPATVYEQDGGLHIIDAPLEVKSESEMLNGTSGDPSCPVPSRRMQAIFEKEILPAVEKAVNTAPAYAELRRVYLARVAAQWYRERGTGALTSMIDKGDVSRWRSIKSWKPRAVFDAYVKSYKNGEYRVTRTETSGNHQYTYTYTDGGVDFATVPFTRLTSAAFRQSHPDLATAVQGSFGAATPDAGGRVWLGDVSAVPPDQQARKATPTAFRRFVMPLVITVAAVIVIGIVVAMTVIGRGKRSRRRPG
ncbi:hypothetical protein ACTI_50580 [Actinoplanes sp. OR16]|uniref:hypothetical protein n=1 Tax=Actinoplanes sp. OR16 TaxID=946334 RepID=UPI000F6EE003|nr:hypothetical protein [Actinoplanes sp. OR16]BBH68373.1 hypothetical protein ACTI_50580 [Actinoplanes sp. OR16]